MCGIAGFLGPKKRDVEKIALTLERMNNRGPDVRQSLDVDDFHFSAQLLHSRLSILDLDARSNQPFTIRHASLVFNGEIYNYLEIRKELESKGIHFKTASDTEVLLQAYLMWGEACVQKFEGMWAFAIYDRERHSLFLSRDRFGEKPLYFMRNLEGFFFGSEVKFLKSLTGESLTVNSHQVLRYLINGYKSLYKTGETFFEEVQELPAGCNLVIRNGADVDLNRYWQPRIQLEQMSFDQAVRGFRERLIDSMRLRLRADVPLAFCLSGGVDSSALVSIAVKQLRYNVAAFSILDKDERYNELPNIQATVKDLGCKHTMIEIPSQGTFERLRNLVNYHDAPVYTISYYVHSLLQEAIHKAGYRVAVSGTAADELVTGYYDHFNLHLYQMRNRPDFESYLKGWFEHVSKVVRNPHLQNPKLYFDKPDFRDHIYLNNDEFAGYLKKPFNEPFIEEQYSDSLLRNRMLNELFHETVPPILHEDDLNAMCYSVENRSPYLDTKLYEFSCSIPEEYLIGDGYGKVILRESVKGILNDQVRLDRKKVGFNASIHSIIDLEDPRQRDFLLSDSPVYDYLDRGKIESLLKRRGVLPNSFSKFLFYFVNAKLFLEAQKGTAVYA